MAFSIIGSQIVFISILGQHNKNENNSPKNHNQNNTHQASSQKFRQISSELYNQQHFNAKAKTQLQLICDNFVDDCALVTYKITRCSNPSLMVSQRPQRMFGLTISIKKTKLLYQPTWYNPSLIKLSAFIEDCQFIDLLEIHLMIAK